VPSYISALRGRQMRRALSHAVTSPRINLDGADSSPLWNRHRSPEAKASRRNILGKLEADG
jgi:hypothetical protein